MTTIYSRASENTPDKVRMGNYSAELDYPMFRLWHYGTLILTLDIERGIEFLGGFSASDQVPRFNRGRVYARHLNPIQNYLYP